MTSLLPHAWRLAEPSGLVALALVPLPWLALRRRPRLTWPSLDGFRDAPRGRAGIWRFLPTLLQSLAVLCLAIALARPQGVGGQTRIAARGVAIEVAIDRSGSMAAADFAGPAGPISRLDAARSTLADFVRGRPDDLVGVVSFADVAERVAPPTLDHAFVLDAARAIRPARAGEGGTNLGHAIALGLGELRPETPPRKVLILLTDGRDAPAVSGSIPPIAPEEAAALAGRLGVTLYTIAVGGRSASDEGPDRERLERLAKLGGGRAFSADDARALGAVFREIDALERSPVVGVVRTRYREFYPAFVAGGLACLVLARWLAAGALRSLP